MWYCVHCEFIFVQHPMAGAVAIPHKNTRRFVRSPGSQSLQARQLSFSHCWSGWTCCALAICSLLVMLPMNSKYCWLNSIIDRGRQRCGSFCIERFGSNQWILPKGTSAGRHFFVILISLVTVTSWFSATKTRGSRSILSTSTERFLVPVRSWTIQLLSRLPHLRCSAWPLFLSAN